MWERIRWQRREVGVESKPSCLGERTKKSGGNKRCEISSGKRDGEVERERVTRERREEKKRDSRAEA